MTSGLETEWDYSGRKGRDGQKKKISKANERKRKVKRGKDEEVNGQGGRGVPRPHTGLKQHCCLLYVWSCFTMNCQEWVRWEHTTKVWDMVRCGVTGGCVRRWLVSTAVSVNVECVDVTRSALSLTRTIDGVFSGRWQRLTRHRHRDI